MERTWKPTTAGVLNIISGAFGIAIGIFLILLPFGFSGLIMRSVDIEMIIGAFGVTADILTIAGTGTLVFGIVVLAGGIYALKRRRWGLALAGSILALGPGNILGLLAIIFVSLGKKEFE